MDYILNIVISVIIAFILSLFISSGEKEKSGFENFMTIFIVIFLIFTTLSILDKNGSLSDDEPNYPMKYHPD